MKTLFNKIFTISSLFLLILSSCKKDETLTVAKDGTPGALTASVSKLVLTKPDAAKNAITFNWTAADYGYDAGVIYTLQFALKGKAFANAKEITFTDGSLAKSLSVFDINALLISMGLPPKSESLVELRVKSQISDKIAPVYSNVISLAVTPYPLISYLWVPGDYQGWTPATADSIVSPIADGKYEGLINYPNTAGATFEFKLTTGKNWNTAYGDAGSGAISTTAGNNLKVPGAGTYLIKADLNTNTWSATKTVWGLIGDATAGSWDTDTDMSYDQPHRKWVVTTNLVGGKQYKFRLNHDWGTNLGSTLAGDGDQTALTGSLQTGGKNLGVTVSGNYTITLDAKNLTYSIVKN